MFSVFAPIYYVWHDLSRRMFHASLYRHPPHGELLRGEWDPVTTLQAHWSLGGAEPQDMVWGLSNSWIYISPHVQRLFRDEGITGWSTYPIELHNKSGEVCPGYAGFRIVGRCGPIDEQGGEVIPGEDPDGRFVRRIGLYFEESTWDGSDWFCPAGNNGYKFATERVRNLLKENHIRGAELMSLTHTTWISRAQR